MKDLKTARAKINEFHADLYGLVARDIGMLVWHGCQSMWTKRSNPWAYIVALASMVLSMHYPFWDSMNQFGVEPGSWAGMTGNAFAGYAAFMLARYGWTATYAWYDIKRMVNKCRNQG